MREVEILPGRLIGLKLPNVALDATSGPPVNLARLRGRSVVFIYPWTGRPGHPDPPNWDVIPGAHGSTPRAMGYAKHHASFEKLGTRIFGLSLQDAEWQAEFAQRAGLPFALLSDHKGEFSRPLDLPVFQTGCADYLRRLTLVAKDGRVETVRYPVPVAEGDAEETLAMLLSR